MNDKCMPTCNRCGESHRELSYNLHLEYKFSDPTDEIDYDDVELRVSGNVRGSHSWLKLDRQNYEPLTCVAVRKSTGIMLDPQPAVFWSKVVRMTFSLAMCPFTVGIRHFVSRAWWNSCFSSFYYQ